MHSALKRNFELIFFSVSSTWGNDWGRNGYVKMKRGENLAAIESQAVAIDPDLKRGRAAALLQQLRAQDIHNEA